MPRLRVNINLSQDEYLKWYRGSAKEVVTKAMDGRTVKFPANVLQPFVSHNGIQGIFEIVFTESGKFRSIIRLS